MLKASWPRGQHVGHCAGDQPSDMGVSCASGAGPWGPSMEKLSLAPHTHVTLLVPGLEVRVSGVRVDRGGPGLGTLVTIAPHRAGAQRPAARSSPTVAHGVGGPKRRDLPCPWLLLLPPQPGPGWGRLVVWGSCPC